MRITEAAQRLGTSPRMLRYREFLGLLPPVRDPIPTSPRHTTHGGPGTPVSRTGIMAGRENRPRTGALRGHRRFSDDDLAAVALALRIEQRYDVSPAALAFGLQVLTEPRVRAEVAELGRRIGRIAPPPARALEFEKERALRLLNLAPRRTIE